jgi:FAD/FMN-containing dehydrogenase
MFILHFSLFVTNESITGQHRYYSTHYLRLQKLKRELDPGNVFRFEQSVEGVDGEGT